MARRVEIPTVQERPRLDLRDALPDWFWRNGPDFEVWGGTILRYVPTEHWDEFDRRYAYRVDADGRWIVSRPS